MSGFDRRQEPIRVPATSSDTERELRLGDLMLRAAALETTEREAFLQRTLQDPDLVGEVGRRLGAISDQLHSSFLAEPTGLAVEAIGNLAEEAVPLTPEERYDLGTLLGEGGMARVHRATDRQLQRTVAIKLLAPDAAFSSGALREARAQAQVQHPNVVEVYETGELGGESYIAMQWVEGKTLAEAAEEAPLDAVVRLVIGAAEGLHSAHRRGLVHRDVKPSNILVGEDDDGVATAYVGDFGIAAGGDADGQVDASPLGVAVGTPAYMSIEQLAGEGVDRRADVYGLGVTLYRIFTGRLPFEGETLDALVESVRCGEFPAPRELKPSLPIELEAIVLRAMASAPEDRYPSAQALADDLRRYLDGEVVEAHAASLAYRLTRWGLRNRRLIQVAGVALAIVLVALVTFTLLTQQAKTVAELRRGQAEELLTFMVGDLRSKLAPVNRLEVLEDVDAKALEYFASVPSDELGDTEIARRSKVLYQIGEVRMLQGDLGKALEAFGESWRLARDLHQRDPNQLDWLFELGQSHFWIGYVHFQRDEFLDALDHFERYRDVGQRLLEADPQNSTYRIEVAYGHDNVGRVQDALGAWDEALHHHQLQVAMLRQLVSERGETEAEDLLAELSKGLLMVGRSQERLGRPTEALEAYQGSLDLLDELLSVHPENHLWREQHGVALGYLAVLEGAMGRLEQAWERLGEERDLFARLLAEDPEKNYLRHLVVNAGFHRVRLARQRGDWGAHGSELKRALADVESLLESDAETPRWRRFREILRLEEAEALRRAGRLEAALEEALRAGETFELDPKAPGYDAFHAVLHSSEAQLVTGRIEAALGRREEAGTRWQQVVEATAPLLGSPRQRAQQVQALALLGRRQEALAAMSQLDPAPGFDGAYREFLLSDLETFDPQPRGAQP